MTNDYQHSLNMYPKTLAPLSMLYSVYCFRNCNPDSMAGDMIKEKIVICENDDDKHSQYVKKEEVQSLGGIGIVLVDNKTRGFADNFMEFPMTVTSSKDAAEVVRNTISITNVWQFMLCHVWKLHRNPVATILPTRVVPQ
ncbi:hypothetical protein OIU74_009918 [Salix koriyanagi]|uniref:PA domain-containing protein n=1 Tax=Salix koriyanagi TaxID=2511006 RepID=A0A9Q0QLF2_9ROSI|nr:hypothetical protein OIU74_009918 [Salix koriyanagi]